MNVSLLTFPPAPILGAGFFNSYVEGTPLQCRFLIGGFYEVAEEEHRKRPFSGPQRLAEKKQIRY